MKTAFLKKLNDVIIKDVDLPPLAPEEIKIRVDASGICGTDAANARIGLSEHKVFGHEVAGTVIATGSNAKKFKPGQKVLLESASACGVCDNCKNTRQELCTDIKSFFFKQSFGMAEEMITPEISAIAYSGITPEEACLTEPLGVAVDLVRLSDIQLSSNVLIIGPGPIGLMALAIVKKMGARRIFVSGLSSNKKRLALAEKYGADGIIHADKVKLAEYAFKCGIDRILVTAPPALLNDAFSIAANGAVISFIGIGHGDGAFCRFDANAFHFKKLQLRASFASPALYTPLALSYLMDGVLNGKDFISHTFPLAKINEGLAAAVDETNSVKVVINQE